jgi:cobalamin biosynthesis Mg chelatase CobN
MSMPDREPYWCPVEDCDHGPGASLASVRSHISGTADDDHDWPALKTQVETQGETQGETPTEGGQEPRQTQAETSETQENGGSDEETQEDPPADGGADTPSDGGQESDGEAGRTSESQQNGGKHMAAREDYETQRQTQGDPGDGGSESTDSDTAGYGFEGWSLPKLSTPMMVMIVVVVVVLLVVYLRTQGETPSDVGADTPSEEGDESDDSDTETPLIEG